MKTCDLFITVNLLIITVLILAQNVNGQNSQLNQKFLTDFIQFSSLKNMKFSLYVCWPNHDLIKLRKDNLNSSIAFFQNKTKFLTTYNDENSNMRILNLSCPDSHNILEQANRTVLFAAPNKWLLLDFQNYNSTDKFHELSWFADNDVIIARTNGSKITLEQAYKYSKYYSSLEYENFGYWTQQNRIVDNRQIHEASYRRKNLQGSPLHTSYVYFYENTMALIKANKYTEPNKDSFTKISHYLNMVLMEYINATLHWKGTDGWGHLVNGKWTGIMGNVVYGIDDISGTGMLINPSRLKAAQYLSRNTKTGLVFIFRKPPLSYTKNIFRLSFQKNVWISIGALCAVSSVILYATLYWELKEEDKTNNDEQNAFNVPKLKLKISEIVLFLLGGLCQQGCESEPRKLTGRIVAIFLYLSLMFFYVSYSANIVVLLQSASNDIKTLEDLRFGRIKLGSLDVEYIHAMKNSSIPTLKALYEEKVAGNYYSIPEGIKKVQNEFFAYLGETGNCYFEILKSFQESEKCHLEEIYPMAKSNTATYSLTSKKSPYIETFKTGLMKAEENGIQQRFYKKFYPEKPKCDNAGANFVIVGLREVYFAFIVWMIGVSIGLGIFLMEKVYFKCFKNSSRNIKL